MTDFIYSEENFAPSPKMQALKVGDTVTYMRLGVISTAKIIKKQRKKPVGVNCDFKTLYFALDDGCGERGCGELEVLMDAAAGIKTKACKRPKNSEKIRELQKKLKGLKNRYRFNVFKIEEIINSGEADPRCIAHRKNTIDRQEKSIAEIEQKLKELEEG